jgi:hypothetical protein
MPVIPVPTQAYPGLQLAAMDIISSAMRVINALSTGETPSGWEANDGLSILNQMIDSWQIERMMVYAIARTVTDGFGNPLTLIPGQQTYPTGLAVNSSGSPIQVVGNFNINRPVKIQGVGLIWLANPSQPLELPMDMLTPEMWAAIPVKAIQSTIPQQVWDDGQFPFRNLNFWCIPTVASQIALYIWQQISYFASLTTQFTFPPGYQRALIYNLAVEMAPQFSAQTTPEVMTLAAQSKALIKTMNAPLVDLRVDRFLQTPRGGMYDWRSDLPVGSQR